MMKFNRIAIDFVPNFYLKNQPINWETRSQVTSSGTPFAYPLVDLGQIRGGWRRQNWLSARDRAPHDHVRHMIWVLRHAWHGTELAWVYHYIICHIWRHLVTEIEVYISQKIRSGIWSASRNPAAITPRNGRGRPFFWRRVVIPHVYDGF